MTLEDELRGVMRDHDRDAPRGLRLAPPRKSRTKVWAPFAAAVLVALLALGTTFVLRGNSDHRSAATGGSFACPKRFLTKNRGPGRVPQPPTVQNADKRLVPSRAPSRALVCSYERVDYGTRSTGRPRLDRSRELQGDLSSIAQHLTALPEGRIVGCTLDLRATDGDNYYIGLRYGTRVVWVVAPGHHCAGSTNGRFVSRGNLGLYARDLVETGRTPTSRTRPCESQTGRLGDDKEIVPGTPVSAEYCRLNGHTPLRTLSGSALSDVVTRLNSLNARPGTGCNPQRGGGADYQLHFRYRSGPGVSVMLSTGCRPNVQGGVLQATASPTQLDRILP